jgi:hypothetical protein
MTDSVQLKLRQRTNIMLKVCELVEDFLPESDNAMPAVVTVKVNGFCLALSRTMDLPPAGSWLDDQ